METAPENIKETIAKQRREYKAAELHRNHVAEDPIDQFHKWFGQAIDAGVVEPNAMTVATADTNGAPSCRTILLKDCDSRGFVFFTNYLSRKGQELDKNPQVALLFYWEPMHRQVLIRGRAEKVSREESEEYFHSRPFDSQIGAWASVQSAEIPDRHYLELHFSDLSREHAGKTVPLPEYWGGYCVSPDEIEFWQGQPNRMHDRILYRKDGDHWTTERLSP